MGIFNFFQKINNKEINSDFDEEFGSEISSNAYDTDFVDSYSNNGILLNKINSTCKLKYDGILAKSGADEVYAVVNYGDNHEWNNIKYYPMHKIENRTFELFFPKDNSGRISLAFKDSASNWDNNSGQNYTFYEGSD